jgi:hypothetical protein
MMFKTVTAFALRLVRRTDAPERPFIVASTCQSEIKRTLRRLERRPNTAALRGLASRQPVHSIQMVNVGFPKTTWYGFERVDALEAAIIDAKTAIN